MITAKNWAERQAKKAGRRNKCSHGDWNLKPVDGVKVNNYPLPQFTTALLQSGNEGIKHMHLLGPDNR